MSRVSAALCALILSVAAVGCNKAPDTQSDAQAIRDSEAAAVKDWQAKDVNKITSHYAADAVMLVPDLPAMKGTDAIRNGVATVLKDPHMTLTFSPSVVMVSKDGDMAYTQGYYVMTYSEPRTGATMVEKGKYVTVYQKQPDGSWKAVEDINNADAPATPAA